MARRTHSSNSDSNSCHNCGMRIFITGGTGFIGSHTALLLAERGHSVVLFDNLSNSYGDVPERLRSLMPNGEFEFVQGDVLDRDAQTAAMAGCDAVIHFAGLKALGESWIRPLDYYRTNVSGTIEVLAAMQANDVRNIVFSSSATVYGLPAQIPVVESMPLSATNPYGRSKLTAEEMIGDFVSLQNDWSATLLRYFNPAGAHPSGLLGENPIGRPNNLMPIIAQVVAGRYPSVQINGNDYPTRDGTCIRDYLHVMDLAQAHVLAVEASFGPGVRAFNLGAGRGYSILELVHAFEAASGRNVPLEFGPRRRGDIPELWADPSLAQRELGWVATRSLAEMCEDAWRFAQASSMSTS